MVSIGVPRAMLPLLGADVMKSAYLPLGGAHSFSMARPSSMRVFTGIASVWCRNAMQRSRTSFSKLWSGLAGGMPKEEQKITKKSSGGSVHTWRVVADFLSSRSASESDYVIAVTLYGQRLTFHNVRAATAGNRTR